MNILLDGLPRAIGVAGQTIDINADYQTGLRIITAYEDPELTIQEKHIVMIKLLYKQPPADMQEAIIQGVKYLNSGEGGESEGGESPSGRKYSFSFDAGWIYAGVDRVLGGKLSRGEFVHWWVFYTAFMDLPEDCMMSRILYLRAQHEKGKLSKEERQQWAASRKILELPAELTQEDYDVQTEFMRLLNGG